MRKTFLCLFVALMAMTATLRAQEIIPSLNESFESGIPSTWTQECVSGDAKWATELGATATNPAGAVAGEYRAYLRNQSGETKGYKTRLISPVMNLEDVYQPILRFYRAQVKWTGDFDTLRVLYKNEEKGNWKLLAEYAAPCPTWTKEQFDLPQATAYYQICFEGSEHMGRGIVLDSVLVRPKPQCTVPHDLSVTNMGEKAVTLNWIASYDANDYQIILAKSDIVFDIDTVDIEQAKAKGIIVRDVMVGSGKKFQYRFKNLETKCNYVAYVRSLCDLENSDWGVYQFFMKSMKQIPYKENFDMEEMPGKLGRLDEWGYGSNTGKYNPFINRHQTVTDARLYVRSGTAMCFTGDNNVGNGFDIEPGQYVYAVTPEVYDSVAGDNFRIQDCQARFWLSLGTYGSRRQMARGMIVGLAEDPNDPTTFTPLQTISLWKYATYEEFTVSFENYKGDGRYIVFLSYFDKPNQIYLDDLTIEKRPAVKKVYGINVVPMDTTATVTWDDVAINYNVRISEVETEKPDTLQNAQIVASGEVNTPSFFTDKLQPFVKYYAYVQAVGGEWSNAYEFRTACTGSRTMSFGFESEEGEYSEFNNNNLKNYTYPTCVQTFSTDPERPATSIMTTASNARTGKKVLAVSSMPGRDAWAVFPPVTDTIIQGMEIEFYARCSSSSYYKTTWLAIGLMTNPGDLTTFEQIDIFNLASTSYQRCYANFADYKGEGKYIAIRWQDSKDGSVGTTNCYPYIDDVTIKPLGSCITPKLNVDSVTAKTAYLSWSAKGMTAFDLIVDSLGTRTEAALNGLNATSKGVKYYGRLEDTTRFVIPEDKVHWGRTYYSYIRSVCDKDEKSYWSPAISYTLGVPEKVTLPYTEDFEYFGSGSGTQAAGWEHFTAIGKGSTTSKYPYIYSGSSYAHASTYSLYFYAYRGSSSCYGGYAFAPNLDVDDLSKLKVSFWGRASSAATAPTSTATSFYVDTLYIGVAPTRGDTAGIIWLDSISVPTTTVNYYYTEFTNWTPQMGKNIVFSTYHPDSTRATTYNSLYIDDISFESVVNIKPYDLEALNISGNSVDFQWKGEATDGWRIVLTTEPIRPDTVAKVDPAKVVIKDSLITTNPVSLKNLQPQTNYYFYIKPEAGNAKSWTEGYNVLTSCLKLKPSKSTKETFEGRYGATYTGTTALKAYETPDCWTITGTQRPTSSTYQSGLYVYKNTTAVSSRTYAHEGFASAKIYAYKSTAATSQCDVAWLATPELDVEDMSTVSLEFWLKSGGTTANTYVFRIGLMSDPDDYSTFQEIWSKQMASTAWTKYEIAFADLTLPQNPGKYVAFATNEKLTNYYYIDEVAITASTCKAPNPVLTQLTDSSVRVTYASENTDMRVILVKDSSFNEDKLNAADNKAYLAKMTADSILFKDTIIQDFIGWAIKGLESNTAYYMALQNLCAEDSSKWKTTEFQTLCGAQEAGDLGLITFESGFKDTTAVPSSDVTWVKKVECWTTGNKKSKNQTYIPYVVKGAVAPSDSKGLRFYSTTTYNGAYAIMPEVAVDSIKRLQVSFKMRTMNPGNASIPTSRNAYAYAMIVGITTDPSDLATFVPLDTVTVPDLECHDYIVRFNDYKGDYKENYGKFVTFLSEFDASNAVIIDDVKLDTIPDCATPLKIRVSNITDAEADVTWTGLSAKYRVMVTSQSIDKLNWETNTEAVVVDSIVTAKSLHLTKLNGVTTYYVYIKALCDEDKGAWVLDEVLFATDCPAAAALPYYEDFDRYPSGSKNHPACWVSYYNGAVNDDASYPYTYSSYHFGESGNGLYIYNASSYAAPEKRATTATLPIGGDISKTMLSFKYRATSSGTTPGKLLVGLASDVSTLDKLLETVQYFDTVTPPKSSIEWRDYSRDMKDLSGTNMHIVFSIYYQASVSTGSVAIDNFLIEKTPTCFTPSVMADSVGSTSARFSITPFFETDNKWDIRIISEDKKDTIISTVDTIRPLISGLKHSSNYTYQIRTNCGGGDLSSWSDELAMETKWIIGSGMFYGFEASEPAVNHPISNSTSYKIHPSFITNNYNKTTGEPYSSSSYSPYQSTQTNTAQRARTGEGYMYFYNSSNYDNGHIIFPEIEGADTLQISFDVRSASVNAGDTILETNTYPFADIVLATINETGDITSLNKFATYKLSTYELGEKVTEKKNLLFDHIVAALPNMTGKRLILMQDIALTSYVYLDNVRFEKKAGYTTPRLGKAVVNPTSITLNWDANGATKWNVYLVSSKDAFPLDSVADKDIAAKQLAVTTTSATFDGLVPGNTYYAFLQIADAEGLGATSPRKRYQLPVAEKIASDSIITFEGTHTTKMDVDLEAVFPRSATAGDTLYAMSLNWFTGNDASTTRTQHPWARLDEYSVTGTSVSAGIHIAHNGKRALQLYSTVAGICTGPYAAMPLVDVDFDTIQVNFWARPFSETSAGKVAITGTTYGGKPLLVGTMTDPNDPSTFALIDSLFYANTTYTTSTEIASLANGGWQQFSFRLQSAKGQYIAFAAPVAGQWYIDDISFGKRTCLVPNNVKVTETTGHTATIAWGTWDDAPSQLQIATRSNMQSEYVIVDTILAAGLDTCVVEGLEGTTTYYYCVRQKCDAESTSDWSIIKDFRTACSEIDAQKVYTFEEDETDWVLPSGTTSTTYYYPECWSVGNTYTATTSTYLYNPYRTNSSGTSWYAHNTVNPLNAPQGAKISSVSLRLYSYMSSSGPEYSYLQWASMPELSDKADMDTLQLSFYALPGAYNPTSEKISTTYTGQYYFPVIFVGIMSDPSDLSTFHMLDTLIYDRDLTTATVANPANDYMFQRFTVSLKDARKYGNYVTFMANYEEAMKILPEKAAALPSNYCYTQIYIDDVRFEKLNECKTPTNMEAVDITESKAKLTWEADGGEKWVVRVSSDPAFQADTAWVFNDTITETYLQLTNLDGFTGENYYYWTVQQICDASSKSPVSQALTFHTAYVPMFNEKFMVAPSGEWKIDSTRAVSIFAGEPFSGKSSYPWSRNANANHYGFTGPHMTGQMNSQSSATSTATLIKKSWLITPTIYLPSDKDAWLAFNAALTYYSSGNAPDLTGWDDQFMVVISDDNGQTWKRANATIWNNETSNDPSDEHYVYGKGDFVLNDLPTHTTVEEPLTIDLDAYKGKLIKIGFYYESMVLNAYNYIHLGNIHINYVTKINDAMTTCQYEDQVGCNGVFRVDGDKAPAGLTVLRKVHVASLDDLRENPNDPLLDSLYLFESNYTEAPSRVINKTICEGEKAGSEWGFEDRDKTGIYKRKGTSVVTGCDSITILNLVVTPSIREEIHETICSGTSYEFNGKQYSKTCVQTDTLTSQVTGCDSIVTLFLTVNPPLTYTFDQQVCKGSSYYFTPKYPALNVDGTYMDTVKNAEGCDSIVTVTIHMVDQIEINIYDTICEGETYDFEGQKIQKAGKYTVTLQSVAGCDSIRNLYLEVGKKYEQNIIASICPGKRYTENGFDVDQPGKYSLSLKTEWGCDSIINLDLSFTDVDTIRIDTAIMVADLPYFYENTSITYPKGTAPGVYVDTVFVESGSAEDCDYVVIHTLDIQGEEAIDNVNMSDLVLRPTVLNAGETVRADYHFTKADLANLKVEVYDIVGRSVEAKTYDHQPIIIDAFPIAGVYTVRITTGTGLNLVGRVVVR